MNPYRNDEEASCPRYESEELFNRELGLPPSEHVKTCPSCTALADKYRRLDRAIVDLGADASPTGDWQAKVRARILNDRPRQRERARNPILLGVGIASALVSAGAVAFVTMRPGIAPAPAKPAPVPAKPAPSIHVEAVPTQPGKVVLEVPRSASERAARLEQMLAGDRPIVMGRYTLYNRRLNYEVAQFACKLDNGHLVTIETSKENEELNALAAKADPTVYGWSDVWIGLDDQKEEGVYRWLDGAKATFVNWSPGEPNHDLTDVPGTNERCAVYKGSTPEGAWDDRPCAYGYPFICEHEP